MKKTLCVVVPTMNRASCVKEILMEINKYINDVEVDYYFIDTSSNCETEEAVKIFNININRQNRKVHYVRLDNYSDKTTDLKVVESFKMLQNKYKYIWLSGDGCLLKIPQLDKLIKKIFAEGYDLIHFSDAGKKYSNVTESYDDAALFFKDHGTFMTYYSASIVSTDFISQIDWDTLLIQFRNTGFLYWKAVFDGLSFGKHKIVVVNKEYMSVNPKKKGNSSLAPGKFLEFWCENWPNVVDSLPSIYNKYKKEICFRLGEEQNLYGLNNLIRLRRTCNLDKFLFETYKYNFCKVTDVSLKRIEFIAKMPSICIFVCRVFLYLKNKISNGGNR